MLLNFSLYFIVYLELEQEHQAALQGREETIYHINQKYEHNIIYLLGQVKAEASTGEVEKNKNYHTICPTPGR